MIMSQLEKDRFKYIYYLYNCNLIHDIENNINEIETPDFTIEHVKIIDKKYKKYFPCMNEIVYQEENIKINEKIVNKMNNLFDLNELFIEHENNIEKLKNKINEYNSIEDYIKNKNKINFIETVKENMNIKAQKIQMYFREILPIIHDDEDNLKSVILLFSSNNSL